MSAPYHHEPSGGLPMLTEIAMLMESLTYEEFMEMAAGIGLPPSQLFSWVRRAGLRQPGVNGADVRADPFPKLAG